MDLALFTPVCPWACSSYISGHNRFIFFFLFTFSASDLFMLMDYITFFLLKKTNQESRALGYWQCLGQEWEDGSRVGICCGPFSTVEPILSFFSVSPRKEWENYQKCFHLWLYASDFTVWFPPVGESQRRRLLGWEQMGRGTMSIGESGWEIAQDRNQAYSKPWIGPRNKLSTNATRVDL